MRRPFAEEPSPLPNGDNGRGSNRAGSAQRSRSVGIVYGETDDFSYNIVDNPVHSHDMNATILHCLGIDPKRLSFKSQGLDMRLTGVEDQSPVRGILAGPGRHD